MGNNLTNKFVDRGLELNILKEEYNKNFSFVVIYGMRRVGKTRLISEFIKNKKSVYFLSFKGNKTYQLDSLRDTLSKYADPMFRTIPAKSYFELFRNFFKTINTKDKIIIVIDEFPYLIEDKPEVVSEFQKAIDETMSKQNVMLILCGSSYNTMRNKVLSISSPLYGRRTSSFELKPFRFKHLKEFFPKYSFEDLLNTYFVLDGVPLYLLKFNPKIDFKQNLKQNIFRKGSFLYEEALFLLTSDFREPNIYRLIMRALAFDKVKLNDIANYTNIDGKTVAKYLDVLIRSGYVYAEVPVLRSKKFRGRLYKIKNNYLHFWFRFVDSYRNEIEIEDYASVWSNLNKDFNIYASFKFEDLIREFSRQLFRGYILGRQWGKTKQGSYEIDLLGFDSKKSNYIIGEVKWQENVNALKIARQMINKLEFLDLDGYKNINFYIFAKNFSKKITKLDNMSINCIDLRQLEKIVLTNNTKK